MIRSAFDDTICAQASAAGSCAVSIIRISGKDSIPVLGTLFKGRTPLSSAESHKMLFGTIADPALGETVDEVLIAVYRAPHSFTGEDSAEIFCHGSPFIIRTILKLLIDTGIRMAHPGEFTQRAFLNGRFDLTQAEAVADLIASETKAAHDIALRQMKGGFSSELKHMREKMVEITSLMELELDFSEENVEFADRGRLKELVTSVLEHTSSLSDSFASGNAIKNGVPVAIVGAVNTGKSTLLNALLREERAIVSDIPGTTRDTIEDTVTLDGILFRFIDTAGIRDTAETVEKIGIERTFRKMNESAVIVVMLDATRPDTFSQSLGEIKAAVKATDRHEIIILLNKADLVSQTYNTRSHDAVPSSCTQQALQSSLTHVNDALATAEIDSTLINAILPISALKHTGLDKFTALLCKSQKALLTASSGTTVTNLRHYEALTAASEALRRVLSGLDTSVSTEFISQDLREALWHIGTITGEITTDEVLGTIFGKFCIGK